MHHIWGWEGSLQDNCRSGVVGPPLSQMLHTISGHSKGDPSPPGKAVFLSTLMTAEKVSLEYFLVWILLPPHNDRQRWHHWS